MLNKRIIPCLDVKDGRVVKGVQFVNLIDAGDPVACARAYSEEGADEIVFLDITASSDERKTIIDVIENTAKEVFIPLTVGGGIRTVEDMREILMAGADKVAINTSALLNPQLITDGARKFGTQCIVVAIDAKKNVKESYFEIYTHGGRKATGRDAVAWAKQAEVLGAGEILLTSMDCDGVQNGYDHDLTKAISEAVNIPVIASGGAGCKEDFLDVLTNSKADAALAASLFHFKTLEIRELKAYLAEHDLPIRL